jgi:hypothetical protein
MTDPKKPVAADPNALCNFGVLGTKCTLWSYMTKQHKLRDVIRPDYFRSVAPDFGLRHGDIVDCIIGDAADGLHLRVAIDWPNKLEPICASIVWKHRATPCRHDGVMEEEAAWA